MYALGQWEKLVRYLEEAFLTPDTNLVENSIRPFVVGRRYAEFSIMLSSGSDRPLSLYKKVS